MKKLDAISLSQLNTDELLKTSKSVKSLTKPLAVNHDFIHRNVTDIEKSIAIHAEIDNAQLKKSDTDQIQELDQRFDKYGPIILEDLQNSIKKYEFFPAKAHSSEEILKLFSKRDKKKLFYGSYAAQAREMDALRAELFIPEMDAHRSNCGLETIFTAWDDAYRELQDLLNNRLSEGNLSITLKELKGDLRYRVEALLTYVDLNIYDDVEGFGALETPLNELISEVMASYKNRMTRKENYQNA